MYTMIPARRVFNPMAPLFDSPMFHDFFDDKPCAMMRTDIRKAENGYVVEAEIPGAAKEDIHLNIQDNVLTISADTASVKEEDKEKNGWLRRERVFGHMERSFNIEGIDASAITADYVNGVLTVRLPLQPEEKKEVRTIAIGDGSNE